MHSDLHVQGVREEPSSSLWEVLSLHIPTQDAPCGAQETAVTEIKGESCLLIPKVLVVTSHSNENRNISG